MCSMPVSTRLPSLATAEAHSIVKMEGHASVTTRKSVQWKRKRPPAKNFHIQTIDQKLVCCVPMGEIPPRRPSLLAGLHQLPIAPITTTQQSYKSHTTHPNLAKQPTRYSANKNKTYSTLGIVPMAPLWMEMTEKLKSEKGPATKRRKSKKSQGQILPDKPEPHKVPAPGNRSSRGSGPVAAPGSGPAPVRRSTVNLPKLNASQVKNIDKVELFMLHSLPSQKWRSHWVGPL